MGRPENREIDDFGETQKMFCEIAETLQQLIDTEKSYLTQPRFVSGLSNKTEYDIADKGEIFRTAQSGIARFPLCAQPWRRVISVFVRVSLMKPTATGQPVSADFVSDAMAFYVPTTLVLSDERLLYKLTPMQRKRG